MDTQVVAGHENTSAADVTLTSNLQKILNSGVKLSGAASMYSLQQFETAIGNMQSGRGLSEQVDKVQFMVDDVTKCLVAGVSQGKKAAVESFSAVGGQLIRQSAEALSLFDPREVLRAANSLAQKSTQTISHWVSRKPSVAAEEPMLAVDVLAG
jgi:hypothetical protein